MENCMGSKLKRKVFDEGSDEVIFADFCLSSPASKIRRLDADLPPIIEEDVTGIPPRREQPIPEHAVSNGAINQSNPLDVEEMPFGPENNEKAVVLFQPMNNPLLYSPYNLSVDPNLISSFKILTDQALLHTHHNATRTSEEDDEADGNGDKQGLNTSKAIIPWVPSHEPLYQRPIVYPQAEVLDSMESADIESASMMEIEDANSASNTNQSGLGEGVQQYHQWQQQHCMIPQPPHNTYTPTPVVWYR